MALCALLVAVGAVLWTLEEFIPRPLPWLKPGLANVATVLAMVIVGPVEAILVAVGRVLLGGLLLGRLGSPAFIISMSSAIVAGFAMIIVWKSKVPMSIYGISITGAVSHAVAQVFVAGLLIFSPSIAIKLLPLVVIPAIPAGILIAFLSRAVITRIKKHPNKDISQ